MKKQQTNGYDTSKWELLTFASRVVTYEYFKTTTPHEIRTMTDGYVMENSGWHFSFFGGISAIIELISFFLINSIIGINYIFSTPISFIIAATTNYILQRKFTFKNKYVPAILYVSAYLLINNIFSRAFE